MGLFKCKLCGGSLEFEEGATVGVCDSCGTSQTLPKSRDEVITNLFNRANNLRLKCEFDKAQQLYEKILEQDDTEAEAHWGMILCKYGIEYVEDPKTMNRIPTCHRTSYDAIASDPEYLAAIEHADGAQRRIYEAESKAIDEIQRNILAIIKNESPYDVFICYKKTDAAGVRIHDSVIGNAIYHQLTQVGFKVFFAEITLEDKLGREYEPYIFAALNSSKVMLVLGTNPEYFEAVWVKNEWSRFLSLMKTDRSKLLIPCYRDMDPYDFPEEFAHLQAQDMGKIGFMNDVIRGIKKVLQPEAPVVKVENGPKSSVNDGVNKVQKLLSLARQAVEDGYHEAMMKYYNMILLEDPTNWEAYFFTTLQPYGGDVSLDAINAVVKRVPKMIADGISEGEQGSAVKLFVDECVSVIYREFLKFHEGSTSFAAHCVALVRVAVNVGEGLSQALLFNPEIKPLCEDLYCTVASWIDEPLEQYISEKGNDFDKSLFRIAPLKLRLDELKKRRLQAMYDKKQAKYNELIQMLTDLDLAKTKLIGGKNGYLFLKEEFSALENFRDAEKRVEYCNEKYEQIVSANKKKARRGSFITATLLFSLFVAAKLLWLFVWPEIPWLVSWVVLVFLGYYVVIAFSNSFEKRGVLFGFLVACILTAILLFGVVSF